MRHWEAGTNLIHLRIQTLIIFLVRRLSLMNLMLKVCTESGNFFYNW